MEYSPLLRNAMREIKDILAKYDVAAMVVLHTPGFAEHLLFHFDEMKKQVFALFQSLDSRELNVKEREIVENPKILQFVAMKIANNNFKQPV